MNQARPVKFILNLLESWNNIIAFQWTTNYVLTTKIQEMLIFCYVFLVHPFVNPSTHPHTLPLRTLAGIS